MLRSPVSALRMTTAPPPESYKTFSQLMDVGENQMKKKLAVVILFILFMCLFYSNYFSYNQIDHIEF